ncbi:TrmH family RNA methyltransferase [Nitrospira lenta]|uniref:Putative 23S rRNA methyltransferase RlmB n=1 Tax=Nitrospira lenta TaxID=1436998 RepID=A0A330L7R2_9BACT|nr:RNA methyltransferase [Nitrospira lenta]SPP65965.1 putative 23S rRNA methyltransferase RlmB [Nitrospira lenta]
MSALLRPLTRAHGSLVRHLLQDKKSRLSEGAFVIEGAHACRDLILSFSQQIISLTVSSRYLEQEDDESRAARNALRATQYSCSDETFEKLSDVDVPQGILAVVHLPKWNERDVLAQQRVLGIYGERLQDPTNVGTIVRTAAGLGLSGVWLSSDSVDCFHPKVVRGTAGAVLALPVFQGAELSFLNASGCVLYAAVVSSPKACDLRSITARAPRSIIAVGNESQGLLPASIAASSHTYSIPLVRGIDSLNVAVAAAISSYHFSGLPVAR